MVLWPMVGVYRFQGQRLVSGRLRHNSLDVYTGVFVCRSMQEVSLPGCVPAQQHGHGMFLCTQDLWYSIRRSTRLD